MRVYFLGCALVVLLAGCSGANPQQVAAHFDQCASELAPVPFNFPQLLSPASGATVAPNVGAIYFEYDNPYPGATLTFRIVLTPPTGAAVTGSPARVTTTFPNGALGIESGWTGYVSDIGTLAQNTVYSVSATTTTSEDGCTAAATVGIGSFTTD